MIGWGIAASIGGNVADFLCQAMKIQSFLLWVFLPILACIFSGASAEDGPQVQVVALFSGKAMLRINDRRHLLEAGAPAVEGVHLIHASSNRAIVEINGVRKTLTLGADISTQLSSPEKKVVRIPSRRGMYFVSGQINGRSVDFLMDTGATLVAMGRPTADRLQIRYREQGDVAVVTTASGQERAWRVMLKSVAVGGITIPNVEGAVIDTDHDQTILLGMSFLNRLKFFQEQGMVVLECC